jgi:2-oxo-4-hydroxy-4-carboxy-5-ureidoimidazoline decarboxylase
MTVDDLNAMSRESFVETLGGVFEQSPWVAERAWVRRPFANVEALHAAMVAEAGDATSEEQTALLRAHPDLGARVTSGVSTREQAAAGLGALTGADAERLAALNAAYRDKFGFPFLLAVRGKTPGQILASLERRLVSPRDSERQEALRQVFQIARFRLEDLFS